MFSAEYINGVIVIHSGKQTVEVLSNYKVYVDGCMHITKMISEFPLVFTLNIYLTEGEHSIRTDFGECMLNVEYDNDIICVDSIGKIMNPFFINRPLSYNSTDNHLSIDYQGTKARRYYIITHVNPSYTKPSDIQIGESVIITNIQNKCVLMVLDKICFKSRTFNKEIITNAVNIEDINYPSLYNGILPTSLIDEISGYNVSTDMYQFVVGAEKFITNQTYVELFFKFPEYKEYQKKLILMYKSGWVYLLNGEHLNSIEIDFTNRDTEFIVMIHKDTDIKTRIIIDYDPIVVNGDGKKESWVSKLLSWFR